MPAMRLTASKDGSRSTLAAPHLLFHLQRGDYTAWIRSVVKDDDLATEIEEIRNTGEPQVRAMDS